MSQTQLSASVEDCSLYSTTDEMLDAIAADISKAAGHIGNYNSVLHVGAGNGRVLKSKTLALRGYPIKKYGIEKSADKVCRWDRDITFVGGDFFANTLTNKEVDVIFSKPPHKEYERWAEKIINESHAKANYLILPKRWEDSKKIKDALIARGLVATVILESDMLNHNQGVILNVDVVRVVSAERMDKDFMIKMLCRNSSYEEEGIRNGETPFTMHYLSNRGGMREEVSKLLPNLAGVEKGDDPHQDYVRANRKAKLLEKHIFRSNSTIADMVDSYTRDQEAIFASYKKIDSLDVDIFSELNLNIKVVENKLTERLSALRETYWSAFTKHYEPINSCLIFEYRNKLYSEIIKEYKKLDFTVSNALIVTSLVTTFANKHKDKQVFNFFCNISSEENKRRYKSIQDLVELGEWPHYHIDDRYTLTQGLMKRSYWGPVSNDGVNIDICKAYEAINDICVIANLVGMHGTVIYPNLSNTKGRIEYGSKLKTYLREDHKMSELFSIKFYKNGNQHLLLSKEFVLRLNIYVGKMEGWVSDVEQAFDEMQPDALNKSDFIKIWDDIVIKNISRQDVLSSEFLGHN